MDTGNKRSLQTLLGSIGRDSGAETNRALWRHDAKIQGLWGKGGLATGYVDRDRRKQRMAGSSGILSGNGLNIQQSENHVRTKIFMDGITSCQGNIREHVQHIWICQLQQVPKTLFGRTKCLGEEKSILLTYCRIISLQWSLPCSLTENFSDHLDWSSFHSQRIVIYDYELCLDRIFLCSPPTPMLRSSGCWVLLRVPTLPSPQKA